ncbi:hypothetical protein [Sphingobium sp.]|jgi:hypothetical protein|uniref:hypothetical protein n=1 Tax=Sphingobium sp. TaxID=1912891 RepID=UPI000DAF8ACA|nr:hypothetical protein [Sphingobium sp.]PZU65228.1 MAG: hypothetical protein DI540_17815 [Sphingobium sp.]
MNEELTQAYIDLLTSMFTLHRVIKTDPAHAAKVELQNHHARMIGQAIADTGGPQAMRAFIDQFFDATESDDAETWLYRRWDGIRLSDGSVWVS